MSINKTTNFISPEDQNRIYKEIREKKIATLDELVSKNRYNKEPFDYQVFVKYYSRQDIQGRDLNGGESQEIINEYKRLYYTSFPDAKTMKDFAKAKEKLDSEIN